MKTKYSNAFARGRHKKPKTLLGIEIVMSKLPRSSTMRAEKLD